MQVFELESDDIQLSKDLENEVKLASAILHQNNHEVEDHNANIDADGAEVKVNNFTETESQYPSPDVLIFKAFSRNLVGLLVENADLFKFEVVNHSHKMSFIVITAKKKPE